MAVSGNELQCATSCINGSNAWLGYANWGFIGGIIITPLAGLLGWAIGQFTTDGTLAPEPQSKPKTTN